MLQKSAKDEKEIPEIAPPEQPDPNFQIGQYRLRKRKPKSPSFDQRFAEKYSLEDDFGDPEYGRRQKRLGRRKGKRKRLKNSSGKQSKARKRVHSISSDSEINNEVLEPGEHYYDKIILAKLPKSSKSLQKLRRELDQKIKHYSEEYLAKVEKDKVLDSSIPPQSVPISADVTKFNFSKLAKKQMKHGGRLFDVIMMDPPWQLSSSQPSRGVAIGYSSLNDDLIADIPLGKLQTSGFLFVWVINAKYSWTINQMDKWGYDLVDEIVWVKKTVNGKIAKGHGFYLQHAKETCLVGLKRGTSQDFKYNQCVGCDVIFSERRGQSQKPNEIYDLIEDLVPNGFYLEIFGRRNNLRNKWVTIGNEI